MTVLSSLLPGLRDLRAPLAAGAIWIAFAAVNLFLERQAIQQALPDEWDLWRQVAPTPALQLVVLPFACYIVGLAATGVLQGLVGVVSRPLKEFVHKGRRQGWGIGADASPPAIGRPSVAQRFYLATRSLRWAMASALSKEGKGRLELVILQSLEGAPDGVAEVFPPAAVVHDLPATLLRLSKESPDQFQQIDRMRGEAEFRVGVAVPLVFLIASMAIGGPWWIAPAVVIPLLLIRQSLQLRQSGNDLLVTAAYLGYAEPPILSAARIAVERGHAQIGSGPDQIRPMVWMVKFLSTNGIDQQIIEHAIRQDLRYNRAADAR